MISNLRRAIIKRSPALFGIVLRQQRRQARPILWVNANGVVLSLLRVQLWLQVRYRQQLWLHQVKKKRQLKQRRGYLEVAEMVASGASHALGFILFTQSLWRI